MLMKKDKKLNEREFSEKSLEICEEQLLLYLAWVEFLDKIEIKSSMEKEEE